MGVGRGVWGDSVQHRRVGYVEGEKKEFCKIGDVQIWSGQVPVQTGMNAVYMLLNTLMG